MNNEPSTLPWRLEGKCIYTAYGDFIGEMEHTDDARLVVDAVNECERLRDIMWQALPFIEGAIDTMSMILADAEMSKAAAECEAPPKDVLEAFVADGRRVLREARDALGKEKE